MLYTYVLFDKNSNFYIGFTSDLKKRLKEHLSAKVFATKSKLLLKKSIKNGVWPQAS